MRNKILQHRLSIMGSFGWLLILLKGFWTIDCEIKVVGVGTLRICLRVEFWRGSTLAGHVYILIWCISDVFWFFLLLKEHDKWSYNTSITLNTLLKIFYSILNLKKKRKPSSTHQNSPSKHALSFIYQSPVFFVLRAYVFWKLAPCYVYFISLYASIITVFL